MCKKLKLPDLAGIQLDSPFVKFGEIKSLLQAKDDSSSQLIDPECPSIPSPLQNEHPGPSTNLKEPQDRDPSPSQPVEPEYSSVPSPPYDEHSKLSTTSEELQEWDNLLRQLFKCESFSITNPLHGEPYRLFATSKELQEKALEAWRLEEYDELVMGDLLGQQYQFSRFIWSGLHDDVLNQLKCNLVGLVAALY